MKKLIVFFIVLIMLIISYRYKKEILIEEIKKAQKNIKISYNDKIVEMDIEDYVIGVVACEMPYSFDTEALKAMSVAARTFAIYKLYKNEKYVMKTDVRDQCFISKTKMKKNWGSNYEKNYNIIKDAVNYTKGQYLTYNDNPIISFYFSISNGYTENCENVFSQKLNYLVSVESKWDKTYKYKEKTVEYDINTFLKKLSLSDKKINDVKIDRSQTGRINSIKINNKTFKGTKFRSLLSLRSTDINITYDEENVYINTKGNGHGVGMSQYGANVMAKNGFKYDEILKYYYSGVKIVNNY